MKKIVVIVCIAFVAAAMLVSCGSKKPEKTIQNLKDAIAGESMASAKYAAFAKAAREEGYANVAKLFEATSKAEEIHVNNHKKVLEQLGETTEVTQDSIKIGTTAENLLVAIDGETYETSTMYPEFVKTAGEEGVQDASTSFNFAMTAEQKHAGLYKEVLETLNTVASDSTVSAKWLVCPRCGDVYAGETTITACNICGTPLESFIVVE